MEFQTKEKKVVLQAALTIIFGAAAACSLNTTKASTESHAGETRDVGLKKLEDIRIVHLLSRTMAMVWLLHIRMYCYNCDRTCCM